MTGHCERCCPNTSGRRGIVTVPRPPRDGKWWWGRAYFMIGERVIVKDCMAPRRPAVITDIKESRKFSRLYYIVRYHDDCTDSLLLEDLVGYWSVPDHQNRWSVEGYFTLPRGWTWPNLKKKVQA